MWKKSKNILKIFRIIIGIIFVVLIIVIGNYYYNLQKQKEKNRVLRNFHEKESSQNRNLASINEDYIGWIKVDGTKIDYPVVIGNDNTFYIDHDFYKQKDIYGTLFLDKKFIPAQNGNMIIYGHHMKDGSMFGSLKNYKNKTFFKEHDLVSWETKTSISYYQIFAFLVIPGAKEDQNYFPVQDYINVIDASNTKKLLSELQNRALLWREVKHNPEEKFLFLVTCDYSRTNGRTLLCAKRIREVDLNN